MNPALGTGSSEFGDKSSVSKLIGAAPGLVGYDEPIPWHEEIRKDPRAIVLFDEGDKAHPVVMLTLMQAFEEGVLKDSKRCMKHHELEVS